MLKADRDIFKGMQKCVVDDKFTFSIITDEFLELLGYTRQQVEEEMNNSFFALLDPAVVSFLLEEITLQTKDVNECNVSFAMKTAAGETIYLQLGGYLLDEDDVLYYFFSVIDITMYYRMDSYYKHLLEHLPIPVLVTNENDEVEFINDKGRAHFGNKSDDCIPLLCLKAKDDAHNKTILAEESFIRFSDSVYHVSSAPMEGKDGDLPSYCIAAMDVSDIFTLNDANKALLENTFIGVAKVACDENHTLLYANEEYYDLFGYGKTDWLMRRKDILDGKANDPFMELSRAIDKANVEGKEKLEYELHTTHQNGQQVWLLIRGQFDRSGEVPIFACVIMNITDIKTAEAALLHTHELYRIAMAERHVNVWEYDPDKRLMGHNEKDEGIVSSIPPVLDNVPESLLETGAIHPDFATTFLDLHKAVQNGEKTASCTLKAMLPNGEYHWARVSYVSELDENGHCTRAVGFSELLSSPEDDF